MGRLKTIVLTAILSVLAATGQAQPLYQTFAVCTGRLMAAVEYSWLMESELSDLRQTQRRQFESLLEASAPQNKKREVQYLRIEARASHNMILQRASFAQSEREQKWASRQAHAALIQCIGMLPSS
mgnify:CR=1 FL=1